jgi:hypothetical protein
MTNEHRETLAPTVVWLDHDHGQVVSRTGTAYTITVSDEAGWRCTCQVSVNGFACWHIAALQWAARPPVAEACDCGYDLSASGR